MQQNLVQNVQQVQKTEKRFEPDLLKFDPQTIDPDAPFSNSEQMTVADAFSQAAQARQVLEQFRARGLLRPLR